MKTLILASALALAACAGQPVEALLAENCNLVAAGYRSAEAYKVEGRLSATAIATLTSIEPAVIAACDPNHPPADVATALTVVLAALQTVTLANAGIH